MTAHILSAGLNFKANQKLNFSAQLNYSKSESSFDPIKMQANAHKQEALEVLEAANYDYSDMNNYSDLSYGLLNFSAGAQYQFTNNLAFTVDLDYYDLKDNQGYVYGIESGSFYVFRTGFRLGGLSW